MELSEKITRLVEKQSLKPEFPGVALSVYRQSDQFSHDVATGNLADGKQFFIASTTKLYITAILLKMVAGGRISLDDKIAKHLPQDDISGLHVYRGKEYSNDLRIIHLMAHTSGLPDYFQQKQDGKSLLQRLQSGKDESWSYQDTLQWTKALPAKFAPATRRKAFYSDSNYQLLGRMIELKFNADIGQVFQQQIFAPLGLGKTYLYRHSSDQAPQTPNFQKAPLDIRKAMVGFGPDGGIVSTAPEQMVFLRAFFEGRFFDQKILPQLYDWRKINFPLQYGSGVMLFALPKVFSVIKRQPALIGHSGLSGNFAFLAPAEGVYMTGTVNQIAKSGASFQLMLRVLDAL